MNRRAQGSPRRPFYWMEMRGPHLPEEHHAR